MLHAVWEAFMIRHSMYAGSWYPSDKTELRTYLGKPSKTKTRTYGALCPHAGWIYSGTTAGQVYSELSPASLFICIGPNHRGTGAPVSVFPEGEWETPLGSLTVNEQITRGIIENCGYAEPDTIAHREEHSLEVQMPFIKMFNPDAEIVAIALADYRVDTCRVLGETIGRVIRDKKLHDSTIILASSDMSHYIPAEEASRIDQLAIARIEALDPDGLLAVVSKNDISMCGSGPAAAMLWATKELGATKGRLIAYTNSGAITGDNEQVVAYAGMIII